MSSETSSETQPETLTQKAKRAVLNRWKLETLTGLLGIQSLQKQQQMSQKNQEAENKWARKNVWGDESTDEEDMSNQIILGDVTNPTPIVIAGNSGGGSDLLKGLAIAALGAAIPGAGLAGYALSTLLSDKPTPTVTEPSDQNDFSVGLGKLEDYLEKHQQ